jgi:subtilase family serine protease
MNKITKVLMMSFAITISTVVMISLSLAVDPIKPKTGIVDPEKLQKPISVPLPDLIVTGIYGSSCPNCGCGSTNYQNHPIVEYQEDIVLSVKNQGSADSGPCTLRLEFYDVISGRTAVFNIPVPGLRRGEEKIFTGTTGGFLYRKRPGITAVIDSTNVVVESNEGNNTKSINECNVRLI